MTPEYKQYMVKGRDAFIAQDYRKSYEFFNAALDMIKDLKDHDDTKHHYYLTTECVFDAMEKMQDYKNAISRIDMMIDEEKSKGDNAPVRHLAHFMQRKACLEIKNGNNRPGVKIAGEAYELAGKTKEEKISYEIAAKIWNEHQRGQKVTTEWVEFWQKNHTYYVADQELPV